MLAALLLTSGCAPSHSSPDSTSPNKSGDSGSLQALAAGNGPEVALVPGASDFAPGDVRYPFLVVKDNGASIERPTAEVWVARGLRDRPFEHHIARLEEVGIAGGARSDASHLYVAHLTIARPGKYWILAQPVGGQPIQGLGNLIVRRRTFSPAVGSSAYPSQTPTLKGARGHGSAITTRVPPDRALLRYSIAQSLAAHKPFVAVFATPKFCTSRTCGPVVDVVDAVRRTISPTKIRFIHVEIYKNNNPTAGFNRWVREWHLPTEPWVFLVGRDGRIKSKFEGSVSFRELRSATRQYLGVQ